MKKVLLLALGEIVVIFATVICLNMFIFNIFSLSLRPFIFLLRLSLATNFRTVSWMYLVYAALIFVFMVVQFVIFYQMERKAIYDFKNKNTMSQGSARWATDKELKAQKMLEKDPSGIILGQTADARGHEVPGEKMFEIDTFGRNLISDSTSYHALIMGATGSGKGVGIIMPTLFSWKESVIIVDPKGESYEITGGYRSQFSEVFYFNPTDKTGRSCHINVLDYIPRTSEAVAAIGNMCLMIHPDQSKDNPYWDKVPRMMLEMLIGYVLLKGEEKSLPEAAGILYSGKAYKEIFAGIIASFSDESLAPDDPMYEVQKTVLTNAQTFLQMASGQDSEQIVTHITTVLDDLRVYSSASSLLSSSDFSLEDIADGERPISLYLCVPVKELDRIMPMFKLIYSLILKSLLGTEQKHGHKLLLVLDEFSQFRKFEIIAEQIPFVRSFGIRIMAFVQSISQLQEYYGQDGSKALLDNFQLKVYLRAASNETGDYFERLLGKRTQVKKSVSFSKNRKTGIGVDGTNESTSEVGRSLLTSNEILNLPSYDELIFRPGIYPYRAKKVQYFDDPRFKDKQRLPITPAKLKPYTLPKQQRFPTALTDWEKAMIHKFTLELAERKKDGSSEDPEAAKEDTFNAAVNEALDEIENDLVTIQESSTGRSEEQETAATEETSESTKEEEEDYAGVESYV